MRLAGLCDELAGRLSRTSATVAQELASLPAPGTACDDGQEGYLLWVREHLLHVKRDLAAMVEPATNVAQHRAEPWWRCSAHPPFPTGLVAKWCSGSRECWQTAILATSPPNRHHNRRWARRYVVLPSCGAGGVGPVPSPAALET